MKKISFIAILLSLSVPNYSYAACDASSMAGTWDVKYRYARPQQVGTCTYLVDQQGIIDGSCENITYGLSFKFFDAVSSIKKNCKFKSVIILDDGSTNVGDGTLRVAAGYASGTLTSRSYGRTIKGTFTMKRR
jgi:hypothetical protein